VVFVPPVKFNFDGIPILYTLADNIRVVNVSWNVSDRGYAKLISHIATRYVPVKSTSIILLIGPSFNQIKGTVGIHLELLVCRRHTVTSSY
jgi:hypothetical protein